MKLMWTGTDVLFMVKYPKQSRKIKFVYIFFLRIFARLADLFVQEHYIVSEHLRAELLQFGLKKPINVLVDPPKDLKLYEKQQHDGVNVLYYRPKTKNQRLTDWIYGYDVFEWAKFVCFGLNFIEVDGTQDMDKIYPIIDIYFRPNRHDGCPRMIMECLHNGIKVIPSREPGKEGNMKDSIFMKHSERCHKKYLNDPK